ncbi:MAG: glycosyltransferase family 4 protein [Candidatus Gracilibacteria bacterium]
MRKNLIKRILHITPHLGGGVGRVLLGYFPKAIKNRDFEHTVACLDDANEHSLDVAQNIGLKLFDKMSGKKEKLLKMIAEADIVLIHWWNHPLLYDFLVKSPLPPCRLILWSHISGFHPPYVFTPKILHYPEVFVFTTPLSFETPEIQALSDKNKKKLRVIWSTGGIGHVENVKPKPHKGFNIGYIGTVDYCKMHPDFLKICAGIKIPDVHFIVCGGPKEQELKRETQKLGIAEKFDFTGPISDISKYLCLFDLFGYPLAPYHYGTCDQVLAESMAAGVVPVVLSNPMEKHMIKNGITGRVAKDEKAYIHAIQALYKNKKLKNSLSKKAQEYALDFFSTDKMAKEWEFIFNKTLLSPKTHKKWNISKKNSRISTQDVFLESLGSYGKIFKAYCKATDKKNREKWRKEIIKLGQSPTWQALTRGTVHHYNSFFPGDKNLVAWGKIMIDIKNK